MLRNLDGTLRPGVVNGCRMKPYYGVKQPIAPPQVLSIRCEPIAERHPQEMTQGNSHGKQTQTSTIKKKKRKMQICEKRLEKRLSKNDKTTINEAADDHEIAINLEGSNDTQINEKIRGKIIKEKKSKGVSEHDTTKAASTSNSPLSQQQNTMSKGRATSKALQPILLPIVPSLNNAKSDEWATKVGFKRLLSHNWVVLAQPPGVEELIRSFVETDSVVIAGRLSVLVDTQLVHEVLGLHDEGITDPKKTYPVQSEIPSTGQMRQTKDVADPERRSQFQFYLHNVVHMAKSEDMSIKNYSRLRAAEEGVEINWWAAIYLENLRKRAAAVLEKGGPTVVRAHLQALAQAVAKDPETRKQGVHTKEPMPVLHKTQPEPTPAVGGATAGTSKKDAPATFKNMGDPEKANPFAKIEDMMSRKRRKIHKDAPGQVPQIEKTDVQQGQPQEPLPKEPVQKEQPQQSKEKEENREAQQKEQTKQKEDEGKGKAQEKTNEEGTTIINLTSEPDREEELITPPSGLDSFLEEAMKVMEDVNEFQRQGMLLHKHVDKIHKEAWDKLSAAQSRVKRCVFGYLQPAQNKVKELWKEEKEALHKKYQEDILWLKDICDVKDDNRREALETSKNLKEELNKQQKETNLAKGQLNKQQEETTLAKEQEKICREAQNKMQKLYEEARRDAQALPNIKARVTTLEKDREKALADQQAIAKEKAELHRIMKVKDEVIGALQQENWKQTMDDMKNDMIKSKAHGRTACPGEQTTEAPGGGGQRGADVDPTGQGHPTSSFDGNLESYLGQSPQGGVPNKARHCL